MTTELHATSRLATAVGRSINQAIRGHRQYVETLGEQTVKDGTALGFVELEGDGEATVDIAFPLKFFERPLFTVGLELRGNAYLTWGAFPTWSAVVAKWQIDQISDDTAVYTGAQLAISTANTIKAMLHYSFQSRAFTDPAAPSDSVTGPM